MPVGISAMHEDEPTGRLYVSEFDHTGDRGIEVHADTLAELFQASAEGMFRILFDRPVDELTIKLDIQIEANDLGDLMVKWLEELNFLHLTDGVAFSTFRVEEVGRKSLRAKVGGSPIAPGRPAIHTEIKAVTYHGLVVESRNEGWFARIIFDI